MGQRRALGLRGLVYKMRLRSLCLDVGAGLYLPCRSLVAPDPRPMRGEDTFKQVLRRDHGSSMSEDVGEKEGRQWQKYPMSQGDGERKRKNSKQY